MKNAIKSMMDNGIEYAIAAIIGFILIGVAIGNFQTQAHPSPPFASYHVTNSHQTEADNEFAAMDANDATK